MDRDVDFRVLAENSVDLICFVGPDLVMSYASPSCREVLGWSPEEMQGKGPEVFVYSEDLPVVAAANERLRETGVDPVPTTVRMWKKDGTLAWMEINARVVPGEVPGPPRGIVLSMRNITERKLREQSLESLAQVDELTGLANRRIFDLALDREWKRAARERTELSLLLMDVDYFKDLNDHDGHPYGDHCLRMVANEVRRIVTRASDVAARYGGEEFGIILPATGQQGGLRVAEAIRAAVEGLHLPHRGRTQGDPWLTVSLGVSCVRAWRESDAGEETSLDKMPEGLLKSADVALYLAKNQGRNCVVAGAPPRGPKDRTRREAEAARSEGNGGSAA